MQIGEQHLSPQSPKDALTDHWPQQRARKASSILCCIRELLWAKGGNPCSLEAPAGYREYFVPRDITRHDQAAQGGCGISLLGDILDPTGQRLEQHDSNAVLTLP